MPQKHTDYVKATIWTETMRTSFEANILGALETCFRALPADKMNLALKRLKDIRDVRFATMPKTTCDGSEGSPR